jgi:hypothetical protein
VVACEAYREVIAERGSDPGLRAVIEALVISTITRQSQGIEMEAAAPQRGGVGGEAVRRTDRTLWQGRSSRCGRVSVRFRLRR